MKNKWINLAMAFATSCMLVLDCLCADTLEIADGSSKIGNGVSRIADDFPCPESAHDSEANSNEDGKVWELKLHSYDGGGPAYEVQCTPADIVKYKVSVTPAETKDGIPIPGATRWYCYRFLPLRPGAADVVVYTWLDRGYEARKNKKVYSRFKLVVADDMSIAAVQEDKR